MTDGLKFYFPGGRVVDTLQEALALNESFIAATDDHEVCYLVDWAEMDAIDRQPLLDFLALSEEEQAGKLRQEVADLDPAEREMCRQADVRTLLAWTVSEPGQNPKGSLS